jgi:Arc/MetJ family transcription regulator
MARTVLDVDGDALSRAAAVLGTKTKVGTVNRALRAVAGERTESGDRRFDAVLDLIGERLAETDVRTEAWQ